MHPGLKKVLVVGLLMGAIAVFVSVFWVFERIDASFGDNLAEVAVTFICMLILALVVVGIRAGLSLDRYARRRALQELHLCRSSKRLRHLCTLLGYGARPAAPQQPEGPALEILMLTEKPKRRGRPPTYSIDRWRKVVLAWENRDPLRNPLTLAEFLAEEFGVYADGSPRMSENSYYDWRKRVIEDMRRESERAQIQT